MYGLYENTQDPFWLVENSRLLIHELGCGVLTKLFFHNFQDEKFESERNPTVELTCKSKTCTLPSTVTAAKAVLE